MVTLKETTDNFLEYVPNRRKVVAVLDVIITKSEIGSFADYTETYDLLVEDSRQLGIW